MLGAGRLSLGSSSSSRESSPQDTTTLEQWQVFSREEGRRAAEQFMEHLSSYMEENDGVSESKCVREFSRTLTDHLARYQASSTLAVIANSRPTKSKPHWWQLFKRAKSLRKRSETTVPDGMGIILDSVVNQMDLQEGSGEGMVVWSKCRLVLASCQENHQLMVYTPPKCSKPKLSLFCFLIEEVRAASLLEVPDSTTAFVVKSSSHGEYVFDVGSEADKHQWMSKISQLCPSLSSSSNGHIPMSYSLNAISDSRGRNRLPRSRSQTPIPRTVSPLADTTMATPTTVATPINTTRCNNTHSLFLDHAHGTGTESFSRSTVSYKKGLSPTSQPSPRGPSPTPPPQSLGLDPPNSRSISPIPQPHGLIPRDQETNSLHSTVARGNTQSASVLTTPTVPPITRKSSAPAAVLHTAINGEDRPLFGSSEALGRVGSEEHLSSITIPMATEGRSHSRQRSYDSSVSHTTDAPTSPLARNCYRIEVGSSERLNSGVPSGRSSAFSSAGNLHEVMRDQVMSPMTSSMPSNGTSLMDDSLSQTSNPLYMETNSDTGRSWANTSVDVENLHVLSQYPWFHGMITRNIASSLTQQHGTAGNGQFLVRQSESREGDFVLTFNSHGNAKHLRFTIDGTGCNIQHLWFEDGPTMIEYFKTHPIPLDSPGSDDVTLTDYIDRSQSDTVRTTTLINMERIQRTPPRRSRSIHVAMTTRTGSSDGASPTPSSGRAGNIRQFFNRQRSSSSQSIRGRATVQRTHSANAGSLQEMSGSGRGSRAARWGRENNYVGTNY